MDHEIAYILFNKSFDNIGDLMLHNTYRIPENELTGRKAVDNAIFSFIKNKLHMKFSMREKIYNSYIFLLIETPHGFACFIMAIVGWEFLKSNISCRAASVSLILFDKSFP